MKFFLFLGLIWGATVVGKEIVKISTSVVVNNDMLPTLNKASEKRRCHNPNMWQEECKEGSKIFETYGPFRNKACDHICASIAQCKSFIYHTPTSSCGLLTVSGGTTKYHGISGPNLELRQKNHIKSYSKNPAATDCSAFTFAGCKQINAEKVGMTIHRATSAKSCQAIHCKADLAGAPNKCTSFFYEKTNSSCWVSRYQKPGEIVTSVCELARGIAVFDDTHKYDECLGWKTSSNKCNRGECDMKWLGDELKSSTNLAPLDERNCKNFCSGYMPPLDDPNQDQVCTHYEFNSTDYGDETSCKLFDGRKAKDQPLTCTAIVATKDIVDEMNECQNVTAGNHACLQEHAEIAFVVDRSGSMEDAWPVVLKWLEALVDGFKIDGNTRKGGLVAWENSVHEPSTVLFTEHLTADELKDRIEAIPPPDGGTSATVALDYTYKNLFETGSNSDVLREIVFITDGDTGDASSAVEQFHTNKIRITAVALGEFDTTHLNEMLCGTCGDRLFTNDHTDDLNNPEFLKELTSCDTEGSGDAGSGDASSGDTAMT